MLQFDKQGYLKPYQPIETDLVTFERIFANNKVRQLLFKEYLTYLDDLNKIIPNGFFQWIDGSFVTKNLCLLI